MNQEQEIIHWARSFGAPRVTFDRKYIRFGKNNKYSLRGDCWDYGGKRYYSATLWDFPADTKTRYTPKGQAEMPKELVRIIELEDRKQAEDHLLIAEVIEAEVKQLSPATGLEPYLVKKQIAPRSALADKGTLYLPLQDVHGKIWSWQTISPGGKKYYHSNARKKGCFHVIQGKLGQSKECYIGEGFATMSSFIDLQLPNKPDALVVAAMDAYNLTNVAIELRQAYPDLTITMVADQDESQVGEKKAKQAAAEAQGAVVLPPAGYKDWNDLAVAKATMPEQKTDLVVAVEPKIINWVHLGSRGVPLGTIENFKVLLEQYKIHVGYDVIKKRPNIRGIDGNVNDRAMNNVAYGVIKSLAIENKLPVGNAVEMVKVIAHYNPINPVMQWVTSKPWDKVSRLQQMFDTIESPMDPDLKTILLGRWFIGAIAAAASPDGVSSHGVLTFQGVQGRGKTMWIKRLAPPELDVIRDGHTLAPENKDNVYEAISHWIVELGEIDRTFTKSDVAQLKSFLTKGKDIVRLPYEATADEFPRRTVFTGTVNQSEFLADSTGNRRFWCIPVTAIDYMHNVDMQQFWAEIYELYKDGWPFYLDSESLRRLNESNEAFEMANVESDVLSTYFDWEAPKAAWKPLTLSQIVAICSRDGVKINARKVSQALSDNFHVPLVRTKFARTRLMPPKKL